MALTELQTKSLKAKLKRRHVKIRESSGPLPYLTSKVGMPLPRLIGFLALTAGTGKRSRPDVIGRICNTARPFAFTPPRSASRSVLEKQ